MSLTDYLDDIRRVHDYQRTRLARTIRQRAGVSAHILGRHIGVTGATLLAWETGERTPRAKYRRAWLDAVDEMAAVVTPASDPTMVDA